MYGRLIEGKIEYFKPYKGGLLLDGKIIVNPTEAQYNVAGWYTIENVNEAGTDHVDGNVLKHYIGVERTLEMAKQEKIAELYAYDDSNAVNEFTLNGNVMWVKLAERQNMKQSLDVLNDEEMWTYWYQLTPITYPVSVFREMLRKVERYAILCKNNTFLHEKNIRELTSIADVDTYDFTTGYPSKLEL